jgi:hypothetical protein
MLSRSTHQKAACILARFIEYIFLIRKDLRGTKKNTGRGEVWLEHKLHSQQRRKLRAFYPGKRKDAHACG